MLWSSFDACLLTNTDPPMTATDLTLLDAVDLLRLMVRKEISCAEVMEAVLARVDAVNPAINAIVSMPDRDTLMAAAKAADNTPRTGPLRGLPFVVKDLVEVKGLRSTHGSPIFADHVPAQDDLLAERLRAAGAIFIGKTNTPEFGMGSQSYNPVHGVTRNPYDITKTAGGSSGGAAAALAARLVPLADGSDMMGSLRNPAAFCNVYGFRPTFGLVPGDPRKESFFNQLATDGPMARSVEDLAFLMDVIAGPDPRLPHSHAEVPKFTGLLDGDVKGLKIGWIGDWNGHYAMEAGVLDQCEGAFAAFADLGVEVEPFVPSFAPEKIWNSWLTLRSFAIAGGLKALYDKPSTRAKLKPEAIWEIECGLALSSMEVFEASTVRSSWYRQLARAFERFDVLALPSAQVFPFDADTHWPSEIAGRPMATYHQWMEVVIPASLVGVPALNVPVGFTASGLPMGLQLIGPKGADLKLLRLGHAYHQATNWVENVPWV
ncbi:glutamyl-tRNA(Gln) amidotransferase subunit A [Roseibium sp. TrichSKD4]|nr:glutamyl-tRNA(Gln) amidotransferase subunit A [Roseibium sp. TrichSKD4]